MSKQDFDAFINQVQQKKDEPKIDWGNIRDEWLNNVSEFYQIIKIFLEEYKSSGKLNYTFSKKELFEADIGGYFVDVMEIKLGHYKAKLEPFGINIISAYGRIDLKGANGIARFILVDKKATSPKIKITFAIESSGTDTDIQETKPIELAWKVATPPPSIKYMDLTEDIFFDALLEVVGG